MGGKFMSEEIITETNRETATDHEYGGAQIQVLEGLEAVRKRPGMYIGSTGPSGLHHLVYEIVDNSIDEALAGYCTHIEVTIKPGNIIEVSDNGRGIPVDIQPKLGIPAVTVVYTVLHAGGKFGGEDSGYKVAGGLHGVGASVVNALSEWLVVHVRRDGAEYEQSFKRGKPDGDLKKIGVAASTGTTVTFKPDPEMFTETTEYDYEILLKRLREESFLNAGVRITLTDERPESIEKNDGVPPQESMCYERSLRDTNRVKSFIIRIPSSSGIADSFRFSHTISPTSSNLASEWLTILCTLSALNSWRIGTITAPYVSVARKVTPQ